MIAVVQGKSPTLTPGRPAQGTDKLATISFRCGMPPSTNNLYVNAPRGRIKSPKYRNWLAAAGWEVLASKTGTGTISGHVEIEIAAPTNIRRDISNIIKPIEDLCVRHGMIEDDRFVRRVTAAWADDLDNCHVTIRRSL